MAIDKILLCISTVVALSVIQNFIYRKKEHRAKLLLLIPLSFLYCIAADILCIKYYPVFYSYISMLGYAQYSLIAVNALIVLLYCILKLVFARIIIKHVASNDFVGKTASMAYEYDDLYNIWFLRHEMLNYRTLIKIIRGGLIAATGFLIAISDYEKFTNIGISETAEADTTLTIPMVLFTCGAVLVFNELYHFFNGETKQEYEHSITGIESESRKMGQYFRIREIYENMLPEPLLSAQTGFELAGKMSSEDLVKSLASSDDRTDIITSKFFYANNRYMDTETDGVKMTLDLMHRKNTVIFNPFYRDLDDYVTLPIVNTLISGKKCAVITGRMSTKEDIKDWLYTIIGDYTHMPSLWTIKDLSRVSSVCDVGVISYPDLYDNTIIVENEEFFEKVDFVLVIEPSLMLSTGQVAMSIFSHEMERNGTKPVYFVCDRPTDGLVDTISHVLRAEFTHVVGSPVPRCVYTGMTWDASGDYARQQLFDKETRYLASGVELAAIAIKNQIPHVNWYGEKKVPLNDIKWIAGQCYPILCQYMNIPVQQKNLFDKIDFVPNMWKATKAKEQFAIVEDEFNNMFSTLHMFLSRGIYQSFVNVLSDNYLLRDYMRCNQQMFLSNHSAVPSFVPDYAKTERNTLIKLIMSMSYRKVSDTEVLDEFHLVGVDTDNAYDLLAEMLSRYTDADRSILDIETRRIETDALTKGEMNYYSISEDAFRTHFGKTLEKAFYIIEEETGEKEYVDAKLFSHVTQSLMLGQFVVYDGKYYQVKHISPNTGVVLRRAADLFNERKHYRQVRTYSLDNSSASVLRNRLITDIEIAFIECNIKVTTEGYLEQTDLHNLRTAKLIDLSKDPNISSYNRAYKNKTLMRIKLPECDENTCFTMSVLLQEAFVTMFPDGHPYLSVTTKCSENVGGMLSYLVNSLEGDAEEGYIYIIEDSDIDLGLLDAIDRNIERIMEVVADYLSWHFEKMREPESKDPIPPSYTYDAEKAQKKKQNLFERMAKQIRKLMGGKEEELVSFENIEKEYIEKKRAEQNNTNNTEPTENDEQTDNSNATDDSQVTSNQNVPESENRTAIYSTDLPEDIDNPDQELSDVDGTDIFDETGEVDDNLLFDLEFQAHGFSPITRTRYQRECFLKFGYEDVDKRLHIDELMKYLRVHGWTNNALTSARRRDAFDKTILDLDSENHCDFCGRALSGASYELLNDGRIRCNDCSASAITTIDELRDLFYQALELMESFYDIKYRVPISIKMVDARQLAKARGRIFRPSKDYASRVLGFAQTKKGKMSIMMENGSPRLGALETMTHELTHIWQFLNWDEDELRQIYDMGDKTLTNFAVLMIYEGMAVWSTIQYLYQIGETKYANEIELMTENMDDEYGWGFLFYREQYPLIKDATLIRFSPFNSFPPIDPVRVREVLAEILEYGHPVSFEKEIEKIIKYKYNKKNKDKKNKVSEETYTAKPDTNTNNVDKEVTEADTSKSDTNTDSVDKEVTEANNGKETSNNSDLLDEPLVAKIEFIRKEETDKEETDKENSTDEDPKASDQSDEGIPEEPVQEEGTANEEVITEEATPESVEKESNSASSEEITTEEEN